jgi:hypothetical protein
MFRASCVKLGRVAGRQSFCRLTGIKPAEISYYRPRHSALTEEAGVRPNQLTARLSDEEVFREYARVCLHLGKIPTHNELRITQRELKTKTHTVYKVWAHR